VREYGTQDGADAPAQRADQADEVELGYGTGYQYDHDAEGGIALDQTGFPDAMGERVYYVRWQLK
jgi:putative ATPase